MQGYGHMGAITMAWTIIFASVFMFCWVLGLKLSWNMEVDIH